MTPERPDGKPSLPRKVLLALLPVLCLLVGAELVARCLPRHRSAHPTRAGFVIPDRQLIWRLNPFGPDVNTRGFRDREFNDDADWSILLLGDSVSWGDGIDDIAQVYPQRMEDILTQSSTGAVVEVMNTAVPGYSTFQQQRFLELRGLDYAPDLIIHQFCLNDVTERYAALAQYGGDTVFLGVDTRTGVPGLYGWMLRHSRAFSGAVRWLMHRGRELQAYDVRKLARDELSPELEEAWALTLSELDGIRRLAESRRIPLLLVITPYQFQLEDPAGQNQPQRRLLAYAREHNLPAVDLLPFFARFTEHQPLASLFNDANHFSIVGHELTAQVLAGDVARRLEQLSGSDDSGDTP